MSCCFDGSLGFPSSSFRRRPESILILVLLAACRKMDPGLRRDDGGVCAMARAARGR
jgi:hypothetical protein